MIFKVTSFLLHNEVKKKAKDYETDLLCSFVVEMMAQLSILGDLWLMTFLFGIIWIICLALYFKFYVRIIRQGTHYRHYRRGVLIKEGNSAAFIIRIPFIDKLEIDDESSYSTTKNRIKGLIKTVPQGECYVHFRKGRPIMKLYGETSVKLIPFLDWLEIFDEDLHPGDLASIGDDDTRRN